MALLHSWALPWMLLARSQAGAGTVALILAVTAWWLVIFGAVALTITMTAPVGEADAVFVTPGQDAHLVAGHLDSWLIPSNHVTFNDYHGGALVGRERIITDAVSRPGWIRVSEGQAVRVMVVVGNAVEIELLEGPGTGDRGWIDMTYLRP